MEEKIEKNIFMSHQTVKKQNPSSGEIS